jgi:outer membrane protein TolC
LIAGEAFAFWITPSSMSMRRLHNGFILLGIASLCLSGCAKKFRPAISASGVYHKLTHVSPENYLSDTDQGVATGTLVEALASEPLTLQTPERTPWLITPDEAIQIAVERSKILQDLGGSTLRATNGINSLHDPALQATDPRLGIESALAAFDAQFNSRLSVNKNDLPLNNRLIGGGTNLLQQDLINYQNELVKTTAYGTDLYARKNTSYDANNAPSNLFPSVWQTNIEVGFRHPLARGGGLEYNRIAGPKATPGTYNGILIARVSSDSAILDYEMAIRDLVSDVENAYWDLYFAYRNLEAKIAARDEALNTWRVEKTYRDQQAGSSDKEARAREQYYRFEAQVLEALTGREVDGTRTNNGSSGGTFRGIEGVHTAERRLRLLMNLPINDNRILKPAHDPILVQVLFDWGQLVQESLRLRPELRKQDLQISRSRLEYLASRNALKPQLDLVSQYRLRGFGDDLWSKSQAEFDNAVASMTSGQFQEWQFGVEMNLPVGFRRAYNNLKNAQLKLAKEQELLNAKEKRVVHDLSNAYASAIRSFAVAQTTFNQRVAAHEQLAILKNLEENNNQVNVNEVLDAQSRVSQSDTAFYDALVRYMISLKNIHYEKGTLLEYNNIVFADGIRTSRSSTPRLMVAANAPTGSALPDTRIPSKDTPFANESIMAEPIDNLQPMVPEQEIPARESELSPPALPMP